MLKPSQQRSDLPMKKKTLGSMIAELRKEHGMTQLELADRMGVTDKAVSKWERDLSCPDLNSMPKLAEIFGVSVDELMRVKVSQEPDHRRGNIDAMVSLVLKAVAVAMGVAVVVLCTVGEMEPGSAVGMLGIGLASLGVSQLINSDGNQ